MPTRLHRLWAGLRRSVVLLLPMVLAGAVMRRFLISAGMRRGDQAVIDAKRAQQAFREPIGHNCRESWTPSNHLRGYPFHWSPLWMPL